MPPITETFAACLERLAKERRLSRVGHDSWDITVRGTSAATLRKVREGKRLPNPPLIEAVAQLEERDAASFPEYALAKARRALEKATRLLDENAYGLVAATGTLERIAAPVKALEADAPLAPPDELAHFDEAAQPTAQRAPSKKPRTAPGSH